MASSLERLNIEVACENGKTSYYLNYDDLKFCDDINSKKINIFYLEGEFAMFYAFNNSDKEVYFGEIDGLLDPLCVDKKNNFSKKFNIFMDIKRAQIVKDGASDKNLLILSDDDKENVVFKQCK